MPATAPIQTSAATHVQSSHRANSVAPSIQQEGNTINTGRYTITIGEREVTVRDNLTDTSFRAWGDPHLHTSDGDRMQFHTEPLTIDLQDGTKLTLTPTEKNSEGLSYVDSIAVTRGDDGITVTGISDRRGDAVFSDIGDADAIDAQYADGNVLTAGVEVDDLYRNADGREIIGSDRTQRFNEHMLDGIGGTSNLGVTEADGGDDTTGGSLSDILSGLRDTIQGLVGQLGGALGSPLDFAGLFEQVTGLLDRLQQLTDLGTRLDDAGIPTTGNPVHEIGGQTGAGTTTPGTPSTGTTTTTGTTTGGDAATVWDRGINQVGELSAGVQSQYEKVMNMDPDDPTYQAEMLRLQQMQTQLKQITEMLSSIMKAANDAAMGVIRNLS